MADSILGLPTTDKLRAKGDYWGSVRRKIFDIIPASGSPIAAITAMIPSEKLSSNEVTWYEQRYKVLGSTTRGTSTGPLCSTAPSTGDADDGTTASGTLAVATSYYLKVASVEDFRPGQVISLKAATNNVQFRIIAVTPGVADELAKGYLTLKPIRAVTFTASDYTAGNRIAIVGDAHGQGTSSTRGLGLKRPIKLQNTTQLLRTRLELPYETIVEPAIYDKAGVASRRKRQSAIEHFSYFDAVTLFGKRSTNSSAPVLSSRDTDISTEYVSTMGGLFEQMKLYDAGSTGLTINGATYNPYSFKGAITDDSNPEKRFLDGDGYVSYDRLCEWHLRANQSIGRNTPDRLCYCSNRFLMQLSKMAAAESMHQLMTDDEVYGFRITTIKTPVGLLHFTTHPFWNDPDDAYGLSNSLLICDPTSWRLRPLIDTTFVPLIQPNDSMTRWDEWRSEFTVEFFGVESNVFIGDCGEYKRGV